MESSDLVNMLIIADTGITYLRMREFPKDDVVIVTVAVFKFEPRLLFGKE